MQRSTKADSSEPPATKLREGPHEFSLILGGPLYQIMRIAHLRGDHVELLNRRVIAATVITWFPLLVLACLNSADRFSFFRDVEVHVRFLIALPILIVA